VWAAFFNFVAAFASRGVAKTSQGSRDERDRSVVILAGLIGAIVWT